MALVICSYKGILQYMITTNDIGKQFTDTRTGAVVTLFALDNWQGTVEACVHNPNTPNPSNIPGIQNYWLDVRYLTPTENN